ncbi:STAS domain-containing protein [Neobacillus sp. D3-1R]|uniref:STAS domain-containing protein n=1 Tax=Neobacillus sp. D3-1R TaxID=3445778 RepID=UPI003F9FBEB5
MNLVEGFKEYLIQYAEKISIEIVNYNLGKLDIKLPEEIVQKAIKTNKEFLEFLGSTLNKTDENVSVDFIQWHKKSEEENESSYTEDISSLIKPYAETRLQLIKMLTKISIEQGLSTEEVVYINNRISYLLDLSITRIIQLRENSAREVNKKNQKVITELSSPVVPIQNGRAILPLIGEFDLDRSEHILNSVIPKINELKIETIIIDFSGIVTIDNVVANRILNIHEVLQLLGISTIFTGIRPDLASKIVNSGIDFSDFHTFGTVQQAIKSMG